MNNPELVPVQHPSRLRIIGAPEPEVSFHYFTAGTSLDSDILDRLRTKAAFLSELSGPDVNHTEEAPSCTAVRDLFAGTPAAGNVILTCEKDHHMDVHAHRMTNLDGSTTTWRS